MKDYFSAYLFLLVLQLLTFPAAAEKTLQYEREIRDIDTRSPDLMDLFIARKKEGVVVGYTATSKLISLWWGEYGVTSADVIIRINGIALRNNQALRRALHNSAEAKFMRVVMLRNHEEIAFSVTWE